MNDDVSTPVDIGRTLEFSILDRCWSAVINPLVIEDMHTSILASVKTQTIGVFSNDAQTVDSYSKDYCGAYSYKLEGFPHEDLFYADQLPKTPLNFIGLTLTLETLENPHLADMYDMTMTVWLEDFPEIAPLAVEFKLIVDPCVLDVFETVFHGSTFFHYMLGSKETLMTSQITSIQDPLCKDLVRLVVEPEVDWFTPNDDGSLSIMTDDHNLGGKKHVINVTPIFESFPDEIKGDPIPFEVYFELPKANSPPFFVDEPELVHEVNRTKIWSFPPGRRWSFELPEVGDLDEGDEPTLRVALQETKDFLQYDSATQEVYITRDKASKLVPGESYSFKVYLSDANMTIDYTFYLNVANMTTGFEILIANELLVEEETSSLATGPVPKIKSIDYKGTVLITFDREVTLYELQEIVNRTIEIDGQTLPALQVEVLPGEWSNFADLSMTWNATEMTSRNLTLVITFKEAFKVSASFDPDYLQVTFNDPLLCISAGAGVIKEKHRVLIINMPR